MDNITLKISSKLQEAYRIAAIRQLVKHGEDNYNNYTDDMDLISDKIKKMQKKIADDAAEAVSFPDL